jgi:peroxiredoxin/predicted 2-oxoglutarate/Fe(II)-dependent dioxygenase YbiX
VPPVPGEPAPWFTGRTHSNPAFQFDLAAGRTVVLSFFGSAADPGSAEVLRQFSAARARFDDQRCCFFGVSTDPEDERAGRLAESVPGVRWFWDFDRAISSRYGLLGEAGEYRRMTFVLDARLRVVGALAYGEGHAARVLRLLDELPPAAPARLAAPQAPVLVVPYVFEPAFCRRLIAYYEEKGGEDSGFMRDVDGRTVGIIQHEFKRRRDCTIEDEALRRACMVRIHNRLAPEIGKAYQFRVTRMERYIVACYDGGERGHFRAHRDNTTRGTAHRRFAVSLFLNTGEYEGGLLRFPEFGPELYAAPAGGAVIFSCSLLHEATPVTRGRRYMFLPFLYDEAAAQVRQENARFLAGTTEDRNPR